MIRRLFGHCLCRYDGDKRAAFGFGTVRNMPVDQGKQSVVPTASDILARMPFGPVLPNNDIAGTTRLAAEELDAETLTGRITTIAR